MTPRPTTDRERTSLPSGPRAFAIQQVRCGRGVRTRTVAMLVAFCIGALGLVVTRAFAAGPVPNDALVAHVLDRVSFGPQPGDVERVRRMGVDAYIDEQLHPERIPLPEAFTKRMAALDVQSLPAGTLIDGFRALQVAQSNQIRNKTLESTGQPTVALARDDVRDARLAEFRRLRTEIPEARLVQAIESPRQLQEVMTDFWYNHFNVFINKGIDQVLVSNYERDAIRPYALGHFGDLLKATATHPAMLFYLDNWVSVGVDSDVNRTTKKPRGLNENYARELMELHTLGVENEGKPGGYAQSDVTELARMLTGWTFDARGTGAEGPLAGIESRDLFIFDPARHDNGEKTWLGHRVTPNGVEEGRYALDVLARHPATARHISFKLAQYFVADQPPPALVDRLAARFMATDGDIREVLRTLFASAEFRDPQALKSKFKTPYQFVVSSVRASGVPVVNTTPLTGVLAQMGMPLYGCQTPDGYKNTQAAWLNPDGLTKRINFVTALATGRLPVDRIAQPGDAALMANANASVAATTDAITSSSVPQPGMRSAEIPVEPLLRTLGSSIGDRTRNVVSGSEPRLAAALVLGSPDFMHR